MQAVLTNTIKLIKGNADTSKKFPREVIPYLLKAAENVDAKTKNDIENHIVKIGDSGIPSLIDALKTTSGTSRALAAMVLIRLGNSSIEPLKAAYQDTTEFNWISSYIINEIEGTKRPLTQKFTYNSLTEVMAG